MLIPLFEKRIRRLSFFQPIRDDGPQSHLQKAGTPTMGGFVLAFVILIATFLFARFDNPWIWGFLLTFFLFSSIGFIDDYNKIVFQNSRGLSEKRKLLFQFGFSLVPIIFFSLLDLPTDLHIPFTKELSLSLGLLFIPFAALVIVGSSNALNLTDGLDGLAVGNVVLICITLGVFCYLSGTKPAAEYLGIFYVSGAAELCVVIAAIIGASIAFLWYNCYPASIFLGDTGALGIGASLGYFALVCKQEIPYAIASMVLILEALSVIFQRLYFKATGGKRLFKMAPLHHHFELLGCPESKIIIRFWIVSILCAALAFATLKIR